MTDFIIEIIAAILWVVAIVFLSPYIVAIFNWLVSKLWNVILIILIWIFLNLAGSIIAFTVFHLYSSIILAIAPFVTSFTATIIWQWFTWIFVFIVGSLMYKVFK